MRLRLGHGFQSAPPPRLLMLCVRRAGCAVPAPSFIRISTPSSSDATHPRTPSLATPLPSFPHPPQSSYPWSPSPLFAHRPVSTSSLASNPFPNQKKSKPIQLTSVVYAKYPIMLGTMQTYATVIQAVRGVHRKCLYRSTAISKEWERCVSIYFFLFLHFLGFLSLFIALH